jgi:hypothetical protein
MALSQSVASELLEAFRAGQGVDLVRESVRLVLQELIETEASERIGAERYERAETRVTDRNGSRPRLLATQAGDVRLRIPKLRRDPAANTPESCRWPPRRTQRSARQPPRPATTTTAAAAAECGKSTAPTVGAATAHPPKHGSAPGYRSRHDQVPGTPTPPTGPAPGKACTDSGFAGLPITGGCSSPTWGPAGSGTRSGRARVDIDRRPLR